MQGVREKLGKNIEVIHADETELDRIKNLAPKADAIIIIAGNDYNDEGEYVMPDSDIDSTALMARGLLNNGNKILGTIMSKAKSGEATSYTSSDGASVGGDRKSLSLRTAEIEAIRTAGSLNKNTAVVLVCGSMILTKEWEDSVSSILYGWYSGMEGGRALASILFGDVNPSGKLPFVIPTSEEHLPQVDFFHANEIYYDFYHGYRKLDKEGNTPAYPFGFGLSYTTYAYGTPEAVCGEGGITVRVTIENTGKRAGDEIVQVYVSVPESKIERHKKELKGFARVHLDAGEKKDVQIEIPFEELKYYDMETNAWVLEPATYEFLVGPSAAPEQLQTVKCTVSHSELS